MPRVITSGLKQYRKTTRNRSAGPWPTHRGNAPFFVNLDTGANCLVIALGKSRQITSREDNSCYLVLKTFFGHWKGATGHIHLHASLETNFLVTLSGSVTGFIMQNILCGAARALWKHYGDVFDSLGRPKAVVCHMKLKPDSQGITKLARIPLVLKEKVKKEPDCLEAEKAIRKMTESTDWQRTTNCAFVSTQQNWTRH